MSCLLYFKRQNCQDDSLTACIQKSGDMAVILLLPCDGREVDVWVER